MNIASTGIGYYDVAQSVREMGDLLKQTTGAAMGLADKLMTASVTELVDQSKGNEIDVSA